MSMTPEQHRAAMQALSIAHITSPAESRMRTRTAREQHAAALIEMQRERDKTVPDPEDDMSLRDNVLR
jgi:hypothetical protein